MPSSPRTRTITFRVPVMVQGREIAGLTVREPNSRDYVDRGPTSITRRGGSGMPTLSATFDQLGVLRHYLAAGITQLGAPSLDELLDALPLVEGVRLLRAVASLVPNAPTEDVKFYQTILVFDWRLMSIREADELPISELFYNATRLGEHCQRRAAQRGS